ncbi:glycosyltransferase family 1 protein [Bacteroides sp. 519]|uniref:glycosyltransferase family 1 protein n=1 Tax=Bacteroides sp. 519 TaxID=2302937 RepID=UPI0013D59A5F|nr:glycosyltransferase family 1 protein [Bacteroides sp. 519]NDV60214.1 glycosyltransferase family 1 protein [Bacteroides sp. 519]
MLQQPVRILMLFTILNRGGAETMVMNYLRKIDRSKVIFDFIVHRDEKGAYDDEVESMGCKIFKFPPLRITRMLSYQKTVSAFFDTHPEYTMIHGHCSELGYFIYKEAHKRKLKFIAAHAHNEPCGFDLKLPVRNILKWLMRPYLTHCFTCGWGSAKWLFGQRLMNQVIFFPNAIDARAFIFNSAKRDEVRKANGWAHRLVIGNVARFSHQKNHLFLLDIFEAIVRKQPAALLILIGTGELEDEIKKKVSQLGMEANVKFMGSRCDIPDLLQGMDVFIFPSHFEGLGIAQLEAQTAGLQVLNSTKIPKEGIVIPKLVNSLSLNQSATEWAEKALQMAEKINRKERLQEIINAGFDINKNAEWLQNLYLTESLH